MKIANLNLKKSRFHKLSTKSGNEENNSDDEELKKYQELIGNLAYNLRNNNKNDLSSSPYSDSGLESSQNNLSSNVRRTTSRTKEIFNDRDFLINLMNNDTMPILPKNMHLLTDDDTNQNIDDKTKFKNLAELLLDDKETVVESHFIKKVEDKMILKLYTALSRTSKDIFMKDNNDNKDKNRIILNKLNNIKIQKFVLEEKDNDGEDDLNDENNTILNKITKKKQKFFSPKKESKSNYLDELDDIISNKDINSIRKKSLIKSQNYELYNYPKERPYFLPDCKYNKKNKSVKKIKLPSLETYLPLRSNKSHSRKIRKAQIPQQPKVPQWEPDIDCDLLAYINHNIVKIEDIYNKGKENVFELKENQDEEIEPIEAKEIFLDINQANNNNEDETENVNNKNKSMDNNNQSKKSLTNISYEEETELKAKNKFFEYKGTTPNLIELSFMVEPDKKKVIDFHNDLKRLYINRINEIGELDENMFPSFGNNIKINKIYKYAMNNERNEEINTDNFTLFGESTNLDLSKSNNKELKLNLGLENERMKSEDNEENEENKIDNMENNNQYENMNNLEEQKKEEEKNDSQKSQNYNILYEDESNNFYSLEDNNNNLTNNNNDADNEKSDDYANNNNYSENKENNNFNNNDLNKEENKENDDNNNEHFLKISFSKNISN